MNLHTDRRYPHTPQDRYAAALSTGWHDENTFVLPVEVIGLDGYLEKVLVSGRRPGNPCAISGSVGNRRKKKVHPHMVGKRRRTGARARDRADYSDIFIRSVSRATFLEFGRHFLWSVIQATDARRPAEAKGFSAARPPADTRPALRPGLW
jgi:hypothetical protein